MLKIFTGRETFTAGVFEVQDQFGRKIQISSNADGIVVRNITDPSGGAAHWHKENYGEFLFSDVKGNNQHWDKYTLLTRSR